MKKLLFATLFPLFCSAFSSTNLPAFVAVESVQPMTGQNLTFTVDTFQLHTNGTCSITATFNTEPTQPPRMVFAFCGAEISTTIEPLSSTYPTNSNTGDYFTYVFRCPDPSLPVNSRLLIRAQGYFGGPVGSAYGLDCAGIAHIDWANNQIWLPIESDIFRFGDYDGNDVSVQVLGGQFQRPAMSASMSAPEENL